MDSESRQILYAFGWLVALSVPVFITCPFNNTLTALSWRLIVPAWFPNCLSICLLWSSPIHFQRVVRCRLSDAQILCLWSLTFRILQVWTEYTEGERLIERHEMPHGSRQSWYYVLKIASRSSDWLDRLGLWKSMISLRVCFILGRLMKAIWLYFSRHTTPHFPFGK